jgi:hypothetical protein
MVIPCLVPKVRKIPWTLETWLYDFLVVMWGSTGRFRRQLQLLRRKYTPVMIFKEEAKKATPTW